jgi:hypothetical protein
VQFWESATGPTIWSKLANAGHGDMLDEGFARLSAITCPSNRKFKETRESSMLRMFDCRLTLFQE